MIRLSRSKKDKRVFGVIGEPRRKKSRPDRQIANSVGEGGIWFVVVMVILKTVII